MVAIDLQPLEFHIQLIMTQPVLLAIGREAFSLQHNLLDLHPVAGDVHKIHVDVAHAALLIVAVLTLQHMTTTRRTATTTDPGKA